MRAGLVVVALLALAAPASADDLYSHYHLTRFVGDGLVAYVPARWHSSVDSKRGMLIVKADLHRKDAAQLMVVVAPAQPNMTEQALVDAMAAGAGNNLKIASRGPLPGGHGQALVGDANAGDVAVRIGAAAVIGNGTAIVGVLAAKASEFDALGGVAMVAVVMSSVHKESQDDARFAEREREDKLPDQPDLDPERAPVASADFARTWSRHAGAAFTFTDRTVDNGSTRIEYGHTESQGDGDTFYFHNDGSYELITIQQSTNRTCTTKSAVTEKGKYTMDGKTLVMKPKTAYGEFTLCGAKPQGEALKAGPARSYDVGMSADGRLVMVGPSCASFKEVRCHDHARWEMRPAS